MMKHAKLVQCPPEIMEEVTNAPVLFEKEDYLGRIKRLLKRMNRCRVTHVVIYADREHFSNLHYYTGFDSRFEESLFILDADGNTSILVGNEGMPYTDIIPYEIRRVLYQNFSLQGQPREQMRNLADIFRESGISIHSKVGAVGWKYFETDHTGDPNRTFDLPSYILSALYEACSPENTINFTREIIGLPDGERARIYSAKEIAWAEVAANKSAGYVQRMLKNLKLGISEIELSSTVAVDFDPINVFPMISFGKENNSLGIASPTTRRLINGDLCKVSYSLRGNLTCRVGIAANSTSDCGNGLAAFMESFFFRYWESVASWYETLCINCTGGDLYDAAHSRIDPQIMSIPLNPGHYFGTEEWLNSSSSVGSAVPILDGSLLQVDIIGAGVDNSGLCAICEDGVALAGPELQRSLRAEYPEASERILKRQNIMRSCLGIDLHDEVLPLSQLTGAYFPLMLSLDKILKFG